MFQSQPRCSFFLNAKRWTRICCLHWVSISTEMPVLPQPGGVCPAGYRSICFNLNRDARSSSTTHGGLPPSDHYSVSISTEMPVLPQQHMVVYRLLTTILFQSQPRCPFFLNSTVLPLGMVAFCFNLNRDARPTSTRKKEKSSGQRPCFNLNRDARPTSTASKEPRVTCYKGFQSQPRCPSYLNLLRCMSFYEYFKSFNLNRDARPTSTSFSLDITKMSMCFNLNRDARPTSTHQSLPALRSMASFNLNRDARPASTPKPSRALPQTAGFNLNRDARPTSTLARGP